jgi:hypothetical protein
VQESKKNVAAKKNVPVPFFYGPENCVNITVAREIKKIFKKSKNGLGPSILFLVIVARRNKKSF